MGPVLIVALVLLAAATRGPWLIYVLFAAAAAAGLARRLGQLNLYGRARFASRREIRRAGLFAPAGIVLGRLGARGRGPLLRLAGQQSVLLAAPTRSGKGAGVVIPNLLDFPHSVVVLDLKGENWSITAGYRARLGQKVFRFEPFGSAGHRYNPLAALTEEALPGRVAGLFSLAHSLYRDPENFWEEHARSLFIGLALHLLETEAAPTFELLLARTSTGSDLRIHLMELVREPNLSAPCRETLLRVAQLNESVFTGMLASFHAPLALWSDPALARATSASDFSLRDLRREPTSIYVVVPPGRLASAQLLLNLFVTQLVALNTSAPPGPDEPLSCLLILDELAALGRLPILETAVPFAGGYNLRFLSVVQSMAQLEAIYGRPGARSFATNHAARITFAPKEGVDAREWSELLGTDTVLAEAQAYGPHGSIRHTRPVARPLRLPQEVRELGAGRELVLLENCRPILAWKIRYFEEAKWLDRLEKAPHSDE